MRRFFSSIIGVLAVLAILVGINMVAETRLATAQIDVTQRHLYSVSPGTRRVLESLKEPLTLRLYFSRALGTRIPAYAAYNDHIRELLRQYAALSGGKLDLEFYDPEPFSDTEDRALAYGLQGVPLEQGGEQVYFGLAGSNLLDDERIIPFFQPDREPFLEYDITKLIYELSNPQRPVVGVMSSLPLEGDPRMMMRGNGAGAPWASLDVLRQTFTVKPVALDVQMIDPDIKVLLVAQAQHLSDATQYAIDQFVMRGGRLMLMVDPNSEAQAAAPDPSGAPPTDTSSDLHKLLDAWGIVYDPNQIVGDLDGAWRVRGAGVEREQPTDYVAWFNITDGIAHDDPATADLQQITVASAGALSVKPGAAVTFTPLLSSSDQSEMLPASVVRDLPDPAKILASFKPSGGPRVIAARVGGVLHSAFTGPPDLPQGVKRPDNFPAYIAQTQAPANMVLVADTDILADRFWVRTADFFGQQQVTPFSDNGAFVSNLVGTLAGGDALLGLRARGVSARPFTLVDTMQRNAEAQYQQTEKALQDHLDETRKKLTDLRSGRGETAAARAVVTTEQQSAIDKLTRDVADTRARLRAVQFDLRRDISTLEDRLRLFCIVMVPAVLSLVAIVLGVARNRARARARA